MSTFEDEKHHEAVPNSNIALIRKGTVGEGQKQLIENISRYSKIANNSRPTALIKAIGNSTQTTSKQNPSTTQPPVKQTQINKEKYVISLGIIEDMSFGKNKSKTNNIEQYPSIAPFMKPITKEFNKNGKQTKCTGISLNLNLHIVT